MLRDCVESTVAYDNATSTSLICHVHLKTKEVTFFVLHEELIYTAIDNYEEAKEIYLKCIESEWD